MRKLSIWACTLLLWCSCAQPGLPSAPIRASARPTGAEATVVCVTVPVAGSPQQMAAVGGGGDVTHCQVTGTRPRYLRDLARAGGTVSDQAIRGCREYQSYMDPVNRWQWRDRVSAGEALAACRLILDDLRAGRAVHWQSQARDYLQAVRQKARAARVMVTPVATRPVGVPGRTTMEGRAGTQPERPAEPVPTRSVGTNGPGIDGGGPGVVIDGVLDDGWHVLRHWRANGSSADVEAVEALMNKGEMLLGAVGIFMAGTTVTIISAEGVVRFTMVFAGTRYPDLRHLMDISQPLLGEFSQTLGEIQTVTDQMSAIQTLPPMTMEERMYYDLARQPAATMGQGELEQLQLLRGQFSPAVSLTPPTALHKAQRWADYLADTSRPDKWSYERWSKSYEVAVRQAQRANAVADRHRERIGWGQREVPVTMNSQRRVLDIADMGRRRGVEVKSGYVSLSRRVARQALFDGQLIGDYDWTITWYVEGLCSDPLKKILHKLGIQLIETNPRIK